MRTYLSIFFLQGRWTKEAQLPLSCGKLRTLPPWSAELSKYSSSPDLIFGRLQVNKRAYGAVIILQFQKFK